MDFDLIMLSGGLLGALFGVGVTMLYMNEQFNNKLDDIVGQLRSYLEDDQIERGLEVDIDLGYWYGGEDSIKEFFASLKSGEIELKWGSASRKKQIVLAT